MTKHNKYILLILFAVLILILLVAVLFWRKSIVSTSEINSSKTVIDNNSVQGLSKKYVDSKYHFNFSYPEGYKVREINTDTMNIVVLENEKDSTQGFQVAISPSSVETLDQNGLRGISGGLKISDPQIVTVGAGAGGIAFLSDNQNFGGASREVWFVYSGNMYQISTYLKNDNLLKQVLGTWDFRE